MALGDQHQALGPFRAGSKLHSHHDAAVSLSGAGGIADAGEPLPATTAGVANVAVGTVLHSKVTVYALTSLTIATLIGVLVLLPAPDVAGRVLCVLAIALSYWVGVEWAKTLAARRRKDLSNPDPLLITAIDQKMEQLEDAKWELSDNALRYRDLLDQHQDMIVRRNEDGFMTFANHAYCTMFGVEPGELLGNAHIHDVVERTERQTSGTALDGHRSYLELVQTVKGERWIEWGEHRVCSADGSG
ncbi:MAG: PAS domain-containing protein, partial [Alphaproteobacteria bacterium]|nr:PAS domain-containing protein [Alphaproteobacteria bacterium]